MSLLIKHTRILLLLITINFAQQSFSQFSSGNNLPNIDDKFFHFGFSLGVNALDFGIQNSGYVNKEIVNGVIVDRIYNADVSTLKPGFSVGIITDFRLSRYFNLRFTPTLHFSERDLSFFAKGGSDTSIVTIPSIPICVPLYLKYSAERYGNIRPYIIGGGGLAIDLGQNKEKPIYLKPLDFFAEVGVGCDIYFSFFKLAPELKFGIGFNDLFVPLAERDSGTLSEADKKFSNALSKLTSRMVTLTFNFE